MAGTLKNFYETLGVPRSATDEQIKTAYRKLILKFHPDKNVGDVYFEDWSKKIIEAFEVLSDPRLRAEYDQVYDEHRQAAKRSYQEPAPAPEPAAAGTAAEEPGEFATQETASGTGPDPEDPEEDSQAPALALIREELPAYIAAKQDYLKADKAHRLMQQQAPVKKSYRVPLMILCLLVIAASVLWIVAGPAKEKVAAEPEGTVNDMAGKFIVAADRAYFYKDPQNQVRTSEYLTKGNKILVSKKYRNFYYAVFQSIANPDYKLTGWIKEEDLQPYYE
ncbi:DnaJ domain-containing protein [Niabella drilacis]|uniref:DnaJ domain-containing protein n=1 Tax=Niabella drilacis (strain DSM 25811 / CCM 8410 / CCUG 62505 / LMG 26954 / E90) TaxID=1285928 RepID=A0A1G6VN53_NIADE|nr:DnaJ domain-containing protein [Niabella drilacis]SDD54833.1 DnaJ domain-containing protein [Niabella drilacis]